MDELHDEIERLAAEIYCEKPRALWWDAASEKAKQQCRKEARERLLGHVPGVDCGDNMDPTGRCVVVEDGPYGRPVPGLCGCICHEIKEQQ